jgi:hypothetical protein
MGPTTGEVVDGPLFVTVIVKRVLVWFSVFCWETDTAKVTTWAWVGVQLNVVGPTGPVLRGLRLASVVGVLLRVQIRALLAPVLFVTKS